MPRERDRNYDKIRRLYITSEKSLRELAEAKGIPYGTLTKISREEKWPAQRKKYRRDTANKVLAYQRAREVDAVKTTMRALERLAQQAEELVQEDDPFERCAVTMTGEVVHTGLPDFNAMRAYAAGMKNIVDAFVALYPEKDVKEEAEGLGVVELPPRKNLRPPKQPEAEDGQA
jgi:hypothetical protein